MYQLKGVVLALSRVFALDFLAIYLVECNFGLAKVNSHRRANGNVIHETSTGRISTRERLTQRQTLEIAPFISTRVSGHLI